MTGPLNRLLAGLGLDDKLPPIETPKRIDVVPVAIRLDDIEQQIVAGWLDDIDPDWHQRFLSTDAAARFYREELAARKASEAARHRMLDAGMEP